MDFFFFSFFSSCTRLRNGTGHFLDGPVGERGSGHKWVGRTPQKAVGVNFNEMLCADIL